MPQACVNALRADEIRYKNPAIVREAANLFGSLAKPRNNGPAALD